MILSCHHIQKSFGEADIIKEATFGIEEHEKAALIGINGAGKSTLLKMIVGELEPDNGQVILAKGKTLGYLAQQHMLQGEGSIWDEVCAVKAHIFETEERIRSLEAEMKHLSGNELNEAMEQYHRLTSYFEQENGYALRSEITGVLKGLGFTEDEFSRKTSTLSGGQKTRVALGRLLLLSPDIILLDEPTNHLDMHSISWLENYLLNYKGAVLIVSHDRYFLNRVVSKVIEIDHGTAQTFTGNYSDYAEKKKMLRDAALKAWMNQQEEIKHQQEVIAKLKSFNREKSIRRAESREKMLDKIERLDKPAEDQQQMHLILEPEMQSGNDVLHVEDLSKGFDGTMLFSDVSFDIRRGERVAVIGDNGTGKTTLLKILNQMLAPDHGSFRLGAKTAIGYYDQEHQVLHPEKTLFDEISDTYPDLDHTRIRNVLAAFLFTGDDVFKQIKDISGGERGRVSLAKLMLSKANFLILDEPTNHLDINSKEILEEALRSYTGTVLYVSHDRYFINQTATRILELTHQTFINYIGNYDYYLEKKATLTNRAVEEAGRKASEQSGDSSDTQSKMSWQEQKEQAALERRRQTNLKKTEQRIEALENRDAEIDELLSQTEIFTDMEKCTALAAEKEDIAAELAELYVKWEELAE